MVRIDCSAHWFNGLAKPMHAAAPWDPIIPSQLFLVLKSWGIQAGHKMLLQISLRILNYDIAGRILNIDTRKKTKEEQQDKAT